MKPQLKSHVNATALFVMLLASLLTAQTKITPPKNSYSVEQDIQLGREAAAEVQKQLPIMRDDEVTSYVQDIGRRLVSGIPSDQQHAGFRYTFDVVNVKEINAFALPGGPMFVNRGMLEAAQTEGEVAGVMAHEISHVALRHGTAQASKAQKYQFGAIAGAVIGAVIGGRVGDVVAQGAQFGLGTAFLRFSREYERQADIEGAQIMARAGYDPRDMANMFKTIEKQGGSGGPEWLSDHPNPGNRIDLITREAATIRVENANRDTRPFERVRAHLRSLPAAPTTEQATKNAKRGGGLPRRDGGTIAARVEPPSSRYTQYNEGDVFQISVPSNWREMGGSSAVTFAPDGAYGQVNGQSVFTHGTEIGIARNESHNLQTATEELIDSLAQGNPKMSRPSNFHRTTLAGRTGLQTTLSNVSDATGKSETIQVMTALMQDGNLMYFIAVAPQDEFGGYQSAFQRVAGSVRLMN
jgi:hypothetical protein